MQFWNKKFHWLLLATSSECVYVGFKSFSWICFKQLFLQDLLYAASSPGSAISTNFSGHILTFQTIHNRVRWSMSKMKQIRHSPLYKIRGNAPGNHHVIRQDVQSVTDPEVKLIMSGTCLKPWEIPPAPKFPPDPQLHQIVYSLA